MNRKATRTLVYKAHLKRWSLDAFFSSLRIDLFVDLGERKDVSSEKVLSLCGFIGMIIGTSM